MIERLLDLTDSPVKSSIATITGTITGYIPTVFASIINEPITSIDTILQRLVWTLTSLVAILAIVKGIQQQIDRLKKRRLHDRD